ncbi:MAG TPA: gephyrin-like molybdotransferase Glp [Solirubrobacterales bacterium]|nr:gephyrin-like molybdotransferase Glp [Solirubrobacterales bacterium]
MAEELIEIEAAREAVLARVEPLAAEDVAVDDALGRVLAEPVTSADPVPPFDNSAMDGFAVRAGDTAGASASSPVTLALVGESRAGHPAGRDVAAGEAIAISTGAMLSDGADAVVRVEDSVPGDGSVQVLVEVEPGRNVRRAGEDIARGDTVLEPGTAIGPAELGVLASVGRERVRCARRPEVCLLTTGDELQDSGGELRPGAIRNSNLHSLRALVERAGGVVGASEIVRDDPGATRAALERALAADIALVSGGVSIGRHDHVRPMLAELGAEQVFWGVALRPGKPTWFGTRGATLAFGLPGNPVSAIVTFTLFVHPAIRAMLGARDPAPGETTAILEADYAKRPGRAHLVRCRLELREDGWHATPTGEQGSHLLTSIVGADAFAVLPTPSASVRAGERVAIVTLPR